MDWCGGRCERAQGEDTVSDDIDKFINNSLLTVTVKSSEKKEKGRKVLFYVPGCRCSRRRVQEDGINQRAKLLQLFTLRSDNGECRI